MKYEYITFQRRISDSDLNVLGNKGWELIVHSAVLNGSSFEQYYVFKRVKQDA